MKNATWFLFFLLVFFSCEKTISIEPETREPLLVVDGWIEDGQQPVVILSRSINYFSSLTPDMIAGSVVRNANISISDGIRTVALKEYNIPVTGTYSLTYYTTDTINPASRMTGEQEKTYTLTINSENNNYTAVTTIPKLTKLVDSLWWERIPRFDDTTRARLMARLVDPPGYGNYIRYFTSTNGGVFNPGENSVYDDQLVDGTSYNVQVDQGKNRADPENHRRSFRRGDTVTVKLGNIDKATYDFWRTLEFSYSSVGNPFASPITVVGNVNNGALGAFCGYSVQYKRLIIPK